MTSAVQINEITKTSAMEWNGIAAKYGESEEEEEEKDNSYIHTHLYVYECFVKRSVDQISGGVFVRGQTDNRRSH